MAQTYSLHPANPQQRTVDQIVEALRSAVIIVTVKALFKPVELRRSPN
jgi:hypothetical protein